MRSGVIQVGEVMYFFIVRCYESGTDSNIDHFTKGGIDLLSLRRFIQAVEVRDCVLFHLTACCNLLE